MIRVTAALIELEADDPARLAGFYERIFGLARRDLAGDAVLLEGQGVALRIKRSLGIDDPAERAPFGFVVADAADLDAARAAAVEAGAVVVSESKREGATTLACQDPAGNEFTLVAIPMAGAPAVDAVAISSPVAGTAPQRPAPAKGPTRRDWDRLRDEGRLAAMREAIAGLGMGFTADDPASVLDEMRSKIGAPDDSRLAEADAELRAREREAAIDDALARYRKSVVEEPEPVAPPAPALHDAVLDDESQPPPRTLGRTVRDDDET
jgi:predicted enzyme related to lactoylglutathione lyase